MDVVYKKSLGQDMLARNANVRGVGGFFPCPIAGPAIDIDVQYHRRMYDL